MNDHSLPASVPSDPAPARPVGEKLRALVVRSHVKAGRPGTGPSPGVGGPSPG